MNVVAQTYALFNGVSLLSFLGSAVWGAYWQSRANRSDKAINWPSSPVTFFLQARASSFSCCGSREV